MLHSIISQIAFVALFATCAFAFAKGGVVERWAAGIICGSWMLSAAVAMAAADLFSRQVEEFTFLAVDAATALGLLILSLRFARVWLGVAMLMQSGELALHGVVMADWGFEFHQYMFWNNALSFGLLTLLAGASGAAWFHSRRVRLNEMAHL